MTSLLVAGTCLVLVGCAIAVTLVSRDRPSGASPAVEPSASPRVAASPRGIRVAPQAPVLSAVVYTVQPGDRPSTIAQWFARRGYAVAYGANRDVLAANAAEIMPGARISIANAVMEITPAADARQNGPS